MAKIDFDSRQIGKQIHDGGEYDIPANLHQNVDQTLSLPQRYGINKSENPPIIFDRFPGWSDDDAKTELERIWSEDEWPSRVSEFLQLAHMVKSEANQRMQNAAWRLEKALTINGNDYTHADVVAQLDKRADTRAKSNAREDEMKAALLARKHPDDWPDPVKWDCALGLDSSIPEVKALHGWGQSKEIVAKTAKDDYSIEDPGSGLP